MEPGRVTLEGSVEEAALKPTFEGAWLENVSSMRARDHLFVTCTLGALHIVGAYKVPNGNARNLQPKEIAELTHNPYVKNSHFFNVYALR